MVETVPNTQQGHHSPDCRNRQQLPSAHALAKEKGVNFAYPMMLALNPLR
jgi:hypothetical protein